MQQLKNLGTYKDLEILKTNDNVQTQRGIQWIEEISCDRNLGKINFLVWKKYYQVYQRKTLQSVHFTNVPYKSYWEIRFLLRNSLVPKLLTTSRRYSFYDISERCHCTLKLFDKKVNTDEFHEVSQQLITAKLDIMGNVKKTKLK